MTQPPRLTIPERIAFAAFLAFIFLCAVATAALVLLLPTPVQSVRGSVGVTATVLPPGAAEPVPPGRAPSVAVAFLGDLMFDRAVASRSARAKDPGYPFRAVAGDPDLFGADRLTVANLEGPVGTRRAPPAKTIDFLFAPTVVPKLREVGIDAVSQANNHTLDQGRAGAAASRAALEAGGLVVFGDQASLGVGTSTAIVEKDGWKIGLIGINATDGAPEAEALRALIGGIRPQTDRIVVFMHWGAEYRDRPGDGEVALAKALIDMGADAVVGAHPHWMQGISSWKGRPIVYSLGNFIFDQDWSAETNEGLAVALSFSEAETVVHPYPIRLRASQPARLEGKDLASRLKRLAEISDEGLRKGILEGEVRIPRGD